MKHKFNKNLAVSVLFLCLVFTVAGGTFYNACKDRDIYIQKYSVILGADTGVFDKTKAAALTAYDAVLNMNDNIYKRTDFINIYGLTQRAVGIRRVYEPGGAVNEVVKLDDGSITFVMDKESNTPQKAAKLSVLNEKLKSKGIDLLYVQLPFKINKQDKGLPPGVSDYSNEKADAMLAQLKTFGVDTYDLREEIFNEKLDYSSLFFHTDHHWLPETGLWAANKIAGRLNGGYGFDIDMSLFEESNFTVTSYKHQFLGSMGKRMGVYYAGTDDFSLILPKYETDMSCSFNRSNSMTFERSGSFEDTWIFRDNLKKDYFATNTYVTYSGGDYPLMTFRNNLVADKKILVLRDSYSCVLTPFLSLAACEEMRIIDPRHFKGSIADYIADFKPDIVLLFYNPGAVSMDVFFKF
jgi:hypothetical protein